MYERDSKPVLDYYPAEKIAKIDATMSQIRVLSEIVRILVPLKEDMDGGAEELMPPRPVAEARGAKATART